MEEARNGGIVSGLAFMLGYDTTDSAFKPHRGIRSNFESEFAGLVRRIDTYNDFPFLKFGYLNSFYLPIWSKGTLKTRADLKFIKPLWGGTAEDFPLSERFFLGGDGSVRGFAPGKIGPSYGNQEPTGGISSALFSIEYLQNIFKPLDVFTFFDTGAITRKQFTFGDFKMSYGFGLRLDIGKQLPFVIGMGFPLNADNKEQKQKVFFSMAGQF